MTDRPFLAFIENKLINRYRFMFSNGTQFVLNDNKPLSVGRISIFEFSSKRFPPIRFKNVEIRFVTMKESIAAVVIVQFLKMKNNNGIN